jgi:hypothetical protein
MSWDYLIDTAKNIALGAGAGLVYGLTGFWKNHKDETFDLVAFVKAGLVGAGVGFVASIFQMPIESTEALGLTAFLTMLVNSLYKGITAPVTKKK